MRSNAAELLRSGDLIPLFVDALGWDRDVRLLPVTIVEIGVASPMRLIFRLTGIAQKRGVQVYLCPPDEYGRTPGQTTRRLIQDQVRRAAHHNVVIFVDSFRKAQVWQWAEQRPDERSMRVYEHRIGSDAQMMELLARLAPITFGLDEEAHLTLVDVVQRLRAAFTSDHRHIQRGKHGRDGLRAYDLSEMDQGVRFWWERALREPHLTVEQEYPVACAMRRGDTGALDLMVRAHMHLVARIAWRIAGGHRCPPADYLDLVQTGNVEMIRLAPGFDPNGGARFQTFLTPRIQKTLRRVLDGEEGLIPIPRYILESMPKMAERRAAAEDRLSHNLGRMPFEQEVAEQLAAEYQVSSENVARVLLLREGFLSWDALAAEWDNAEDHHEQDMEGERETPPGYSLMIHGIQTQRECAVNLVRREQLDAVLNNLTPRERDVVRMRFGLDDGDAHTLEEVGYRFAVTRERVRQIELRALKKLRRMGPVKISENGEFACAPPVKQPRCVQNDDFDEADADAAI